MKAPLYILESADDGGKDGRVLRGGMHGCLGSDTGTPAFPHHLNVVVDAVICHWVSVTVEGL